MIALVGQDRFHHSSGLVTSCWMASGSYVKLGAAEASKSITVTNSEVQGM